MAGRFGTNIRQFCKLIFTWRFGSWCQEMNEKFVKNFVMDAEIDPKVLWICPYSKLVDGTVCNPETRICWMNLLMRMNRGC